MKTLYIIKFLPQNNKMLVYEAIRIAYNTHFNNTNTKKNICMARMWHIIDIYIFYFFGSTTILLLREQSSSDVTVRMCTICTKGENKHCIQTVPLCNIHTV